MSKKKQKLDKVRMIAGSIARELTKREIETAEVDGKELKSAFSELHGDKTVIAFTEGWHLGAYHFDTYKTKKNAPATSLKMNRGNQVVVRNWENSSRSNNIFARSHERTFEHT